MPPTWELLTVVDAAEGPPLYGRVAAGVAFVSDNTWWIAIAGSTGAVTTVTIDGGTT